MPIDSTYSLIGVAPVPAPVASERGSEHRELIQAVKAINAIELFGDKTELTFAIDRKTHRPVLRIVNKETDELVSQIPNEQVLRIAAELKLLQG